MKLLVVLGEGGHTTELLNLVELLGDRYQYHYIVSQEDNLSADRITRSGAIDIVKRPRGKSTGVVAAGIKTLLVAAQAIRISWRVRPTAILSTGPAITVPVSLIGKLLGAKIIFVETGSRVSRLSLTGRIMYPWADLFFVQWPQLKKNSPKAIYAGRLI